jgi:hypothetical protein
MLLPFRKIDRDQIWCENGKLAKTKDFVNSKKNQKYNDTKDYSSLLVIG